MKLTPFIFFLLLTSLLSAQSHLGGCARFNLSNLTGPVSYSFKPGYSFGFVYRCTFSKVTSLQTGIEYSMEGGKHGNSERITTNNFKTPVLLVLSNNQKKVFINGYVGPYFAIISNAIYRTRGTGRYGEEVEGRTIISNKPAFDMGLMTGVGISFNFYSSRLSCDLLISRDFLKSIKVLSCNATCISIGITYVGKI